MSTVQVQRADIALPCTFVSLLITGFIIKAMTSPTDKGLSTITKATCAFVLVLLFTTVTTKMLLQSNTKEEEQDDSKIDSDNTRSKPSTPPPDANKSPPVRPENISSPAAPLSERAQRRKLQKQKIYERADREEEQRLRGILKEQVKRRNNELLGKRKEAAVKVLEEGV
jgi:type IV secretory pathway VirB10-like protein